MDLRPALALTAATLALIACDAPVTHRVTSVEHARPTALAAAPAPDAPADEPAVVDPEEPTDPAGPADPGPADPTTPDDPAPPDPVAPEEPPVPPGPEACPAGVTCVGAFPFFDDGDTTLAPSVIDRYGCAPGTDEGGPEVVYRVTLPSEGLLVASVDGLPPGVDVDVHILADAPGAAAPDPSACVDRGHWEAAARLPAGHAWVVVDSWVNASGTALSGPYTLTLGFTAPADHEDLDLDREVLSAALYAFDAAWKAGETDRLELTVIDFSLHSVHRRLWTLDLRDGSVLFHQRVSHGEGSADAADPGWAVAFSNTEGSHQSSLGLMRTASRYQSADNGLSLRLDGLDDGVNDAVRSRAIVIHSDSYATDAFAAAHGRMGLSWGCQVVDPAVIAELVDTIEGGALVFSWYPDPTWLASSAWLAGWTPPAP